MAESPTTARQLRGLKRRIVLLDDVPRDLRFDFECQCVIEEMMREAGLSPEKEQERLLKETAEEAEAKAAGLPFEPREQRGPGFYRTMGIFAYGLTATWREDNHESAMSYSQFRKLLPARPVERLKGWVDTVVEVMNAEGGEGNEPPTDAPEPTVPDASDSQSPPTGTSSGICAEPGSE